MRAVDQRVAKPGGISEAFLSEPSEQTQRGAIEAQGQAVLTPDLRPLWLRLALGIVPAACGVPLLLSPVYLVELVGTLLVGVGLYGLIPELQRQISAPGARWTCAGRDLSVLRRALPVLGIIALTGGLLWPSLLGMMVQSQDHTIHLARAWHFLHEMLAKGQLSGWSDMWFAGYPAGEDYPPAGDYLISAVHLLTLGLLGWEASYAIALLAMYAIAAWGVYAFGRVYLGRLAGFLGAVFFLLDRGQYREGGWNYTIWWGVWPQVLSTGFTFFAFAALDAVITKARPRDFALAALFIGLALIAHPVAVVYFGLGLPIYLLARTLGGDEPAGRVVARSLAVFAIGGALAAYWIVPFVAKGGWMAKYGELWKPLSSMAEGMWKGSLFDNAMPPVIIAGLFGGAVALWRRSLGGTFLAAYALTTLFLASSTAFQRLDLLTVSPSFGQIQFQRLAILAKPCVWLLAGYGLTSLFASWRAGVPRRFAWRRYALGVLVIATLSPFVRPVIEYWGHHYGKELGHPMTRKQVAHYEDYQRFLKWSAGLRAAEKEFFRIAYVRPYNDHYFGAATAYNSTPMYKVGYTPAINFIHKPDVASAAVYRLLNVKYVVAIGSQSTAGLELLRRFGAITVYRFKDYTPLRYTLEGAGQVAVERFDPAGAGVRLKISGATAGSRLVLHIANYPNWRARIDGKSVEIGTAELGGQKIFISVAAQNGTLELRYGWPLVNVLGATLSWLAIALLASFALRRYRPELARRVSERLGPWALGAERYGVALGIAVLLIPIAALALKSRAKRHSVEGAALIELLDRAAVEVDRSGSRMPCKRRGRRHQCSETARWNYVGPSSQRVGDALRRCIWAHPVERGLLRVTFPSQRLGSAIVGHHGLTDAAVRSTGTAVQLEAWLDGKRVLSARRPNQAGWVDWRIDTSARKGQQGVLSFTISSARAGVRHYCFDGVIVK